MKITKKLLTFCVILIWTIGLSTPNTVHAREVNVIIHGRPVIFDGQGPVIIRGNTFVPLRGVFEALGFDVGWDGVTRTATLTGRGHDVQLTVGSYNFRINSQTIALETPAQIISGRVLLPLRVVLERTGFTVDWDSATSTVTILDPLFPEATHSISHLIRGDTTTIATGNSGTLWGSSVTNASYVIMEDGSLWVLGGRDNLQHESSIARKEPVKVMENVISVTGDPYGALAIRSDNSLWNINNDGMAFHYYVGGEYTPLFNNRNLMDNIISASAGGWHTMAIDSSNTLWGWGFNEYGQLGDGTTMFWDRPIRIMENVLSVSTATSGSRSTFAIQNDNSLWAWGGNATGALGIGSINYHPNPDPIMVMENVAAVSNNNGRTMAITTSGELWGWGWNYSGMLGTRRNTWDDIFIPYPVFVMDGVIAVSVGALHTMAIRFDGSLWTWGINQYGQLGDGTLTNRYTPVMVLDNVVAISAGSRHSIALRSDGSLWAWGSNEDGQFGNGTTEDSIVPIWVMDGVLLP